MNFINIYIIENINHINIKCNTIMLGLLKVVRQKKGRGMGQTEMFRTCGERFAIAGIKRRDAK
jgi:hypothetical protein